MNKGFWEKLKRPIMVLAPMADVTDFAYRELFAKYGKPDVTWTEFVSCDGLSNPMGRKALVRNLQFTDLQRPIVAQIFGRHPDTFFATAKLIKELGFDGIDINMGCPEKSICAGGSGAALIKTPKLARELIRQTQAGAGDLPVSVKIRTGYTQASLLEWIEELIEAEPSAIIIHGRTKKEMSKVPADWELMGETIKQIRKKYPNQALPLFVGNGDIQTLDEAKAKAKKYNLDGIMIGRGTFGNPWFFNSSTDVNGIPLKTKLKVMLEHAKLYEKTTGKFKPFDLMKKFFKAYISGFDGAKELRVQLMDTKSAKEVETILKAGKWL
jgi:nifR3 family TIM-barrel protein